MTERTSESLWQDYLFLTREMLKFLEGQDMEMFHELMNQREGLQSLIEEASDNGFKESPGGRELLSRIHQENQVLMSYFQAAHSKVRHHHQVAEAYSSGNQYPVNNRNWVR